MMHCWDEQASTSSNFKSWMTLLISEGNQTVYSRCCQCPSSMASNGTMLMDSLPLRTALAERANQKSHLHGMSQNFAPLWTRRRITNGASSLSLMCLESNARLATCTTSGKSRAPTIKTLAAQNPLVALKQKRSLMTVARWQCILSCGAGLWLEEVAR